MENLSIGQQLKRNFVAVLSLVVAITALSYNTWRNERTEQNRNIRIAAFEILKTIGELQLIIDYAHFRKNERLGDTTLGWGKILFIKDLAQLTPQPLPENAERLLTVWRNDWEKIANDNDSVQHISEELYRARRDAIDVIMQLR